MMNRTLRSLGLMLLACGLMAPLAMAAEGDQPSTATATGAITTVDASVTNLNVGQALSDIDAAFRAGALTWDEARALYAEQAAIRTAYVKGRAEEHTPRAALRLRFMQGTAQGNLAALSYNSAQPAFARVDADIAAGAVLAGR